LADRDTGARGQPVDGIPLDASIDRDGQRVVWTSDERQSIIPTHIVVRLRDLKQNTTDLISRASAPPGDPSGGDPANADTAEPRIDANGNVVAFRSAATNLGVGVTHQEIWVRTLATGQTVLASRASGAAGAPADADSQTPSLDDAGNRIAFTSTAGNLGNPSPSIFDAHSYLRDLTAGSTVLVSRDNGLGGAPAAQPGFTVVSLSGNGNCAAFSARSLTLGDGFASADFSSVHERVLRGQCPTPRPPPSVSKFSPTSGVAGSTVVTITGTNLADASAVKFNGRTARVSSDTATQITAKVPNGATTGKISVTTPGGTTTSASSLAVTFTVTATAPTSGPTGTDVTITGTGFTSTSSVKFNGVAARVLSRTLPTTLVAVVPASASTGRITVTNTTAPVGTVTSVSPYTVTPHSPPTISAFTPTSGITGSSVTVNGTFFSGASSVKFGTRPAAYAIVSADQIKATVPDGATTGKISVTTAAGIATSAANFTPTLSITSFTPSSGPSGTDVTITGTGFTSTSSVKFNGVAATVLSRTPPSKLVAIVPTGASTGKITVTNTTPPAGTVTSATSYTKT
jgi:hypothetical protein